MFLFVCLQFCGCSTDNIGVFGTFGRKTLAIMLICIGDGIRDSLIKDSFPSRQEVHPFLYLFFPIPDGHAHGLRAFFLFSFHRA